MRTYSWSSAQVLLATQMLCPPPVATFTSTPTKCFLLIARRSHHSSLVWVHHTQHGCERFHPDKMLIKGDMEANNTRQRFLFFTHGESSVPGNVCTSNSALNLGLSLLIEVMLHILSHSLSDLFSKMGE